MRRAPRRQETHQEFQRQGRFLFIELQTRRACLKMLTREDARRHAGALLTGRATKD